MADLIPTPDPDGPGATPWTEMRRDRRNTGSSPAPANYTGDVPWRHVTGRGVFTTPVIGPDGAVYIGSADGLFYAFESDGRLRWTFETGGVIDSAALVTDDRVTFGSGDGFLYQLRTERELAGADRMVWRFAARAPEGSGQQVSWWEGNVEAGPDGLLLAGNTAGHAYAVDAQGEEKWSYPTGNAVWTAAAVGGDGTSYWGSLDFCVHAVDRNGVARWVAPTFGFVVSSPALSLDGVLYVGSFDGLLYALDASTGATHWTFATADSIYSSPALLEDEGRTVAVVVASTDGTVYAVGPDGALLWRYDTGAVVRSSPVISRGPSTEGGSIVYVGASDGVLYALDGQRGTRRWSFDTTTSDPVLADRNSLNGSPALGAGGVHIASEDGSVWYVPYDYPLHHHDPRGSTDPAEPYGPELERLFVVTAGGATVRQGRASIGTSAVVALRLVVRRGGVTLDAELADDLTVTSSSSAPLTWRRSGDGHFVFVRPATFWGDAPDLRLDVRGHWRATRGLVDEGSVSGSLDQSIEVDVAPVGPLVPFVVGAESTTALVLRRLSVALPSFAPSVNQIGFDSYDWLVGAIAVVPESTRTGRVALYVHGARRERSGDWSVDRDSAFAFALVGAYDGAAVAVGARGVDLPFSFGDVPSDLLEFRFQFDDELVARPGASLYGETVCADIPFYGELIEQYTRLADTEGRMTTSGTFLTSGLDPDSPPARRPIGLDVVDVTLVRPTKDSPGSVEVALSGPVGANVFSLVLLDPGLAAQARALSLKPAASEPTDRDDQLTFSIPAGAVLAHPVVAVVVAGVYPVTHVTFP